MADLRHITIPNSVNFKIGDVVYTFVLCASYIINSDPKFNATGTGIRAGARILGKLESAKEGDTFTLDQADWKLLNEAFEAPAQGYIMPGLGSEDPKTGEFIPARIAGRTWLPYIDAVSDEATKTAPKVEAKQLNGADAKALTEAAQA